MRQWLGENDQEVRFRCEIGLGLGQARGIWALAFLNWLHIGKMFTEISVSVHVPRGKGAICFTSVSVPQKSFSVSIFFSPFPFFAELRVNSTSCLSLF